jgi:CheY-like chemotaxis protein
MSVVLVVEDEALVRCVLSEHLRDAGFDVVEAGNAAEALDVVQDEPVDVVVTDIRMPGRIDGLGLARTLRCSHPGLPVIVTSGYPGTELPGCSVIAKPYDPRHVEHGIKAALAARM